MATVISGALLIVTSLVLMKVFFKIRNRFCTSTKRLNGKTCIVTGGTAGMGLEIAKDFARRGAKVIIACPFEQEGKDAQKIIEEETGNENVIFKHLDLASLKSTRKFAENILKEEKRLDILVNNAGVGCDHKYTEDGLNFTMQVNYYGHFLLTILLLPILKRTGNPADKSRIVNTTSLYHFGASFQPDNLNRENYWTLFRLYANSKLCLLLFSTELTKRLRMHNVVINSVDPGGVGTGIFAYNMGKIVGFILMIALRIFVKTPWEGAQTAIHVALDEKVGDLSGEYFRNCELCKARAITYNDEAAKRLWDESVRLVKLEEYLQII